MLAATAATLAGTAALAWSWRRGQRRAGDERDRLFDRCGGLLERAALERRRPDFPLLRGRFEGCEAELRPIADAVTARKLPTLWLQVSLLAPTGAPGVLDALLRPIGTEFWSPAGELGTDLPTPAGLPETLQVRAEGPAAARLLPALRRQAPFLARPGAKEVLVTPRGVRLVTLLAEGERGQYLLLRQARFAVAELDPAELAALLTLALGLHRDAQALARDATVA